MPRGVTSASANGINDARQVVGNGTVNLNGAIQQAIIRNNGTPTLLPPPAGTSPDILSYAVHINSSVGDSIEIDGTASTSILKASNPTLGTYVLTTPNDGTLVFTGKYTNATFSIGENYNDTATLITLTAADRCHFVGADQQAPADDFDRRAFLDPRCTETR